MSNNSTLFKRMTWQAFKNNTEWNDQQIIYIADKNLRVHTKKYNRNSPNSQFFNIIYNGQYGFVENVTIGNLQENQNELIAGIYIIVHNTSIELWFYDGKNDSNSQHWFQLSGGSGGIGGSVTTVNNRGPDVNGNITITAADIEAVFNDGITTTVQQWLDNLSAGHSIVQRTDVDSALTARANLVFSDGLNVVDESVTDSSVVSLNLKTGAGLQLVKNKQYTISLNNATSTLLGGVLLGNDIVQTTTANDVTATSNRTYAIQKDNDGKLVVNVPWKGTNISLANNTTSGIVVAGTNNGTTSSYNNGVIDISIDCGVWE